MNLASLLNSVKTDNHGTKSDAHINTLPDSIQYNVVLNKDTTLSQLSVYPLGAQVPYPRTSDEKCNPEGHLFAIDPSNWSNPTNDLGYSQGEPKGQRKAMYVSVLKDSCGKMVPCVKKYRTCQGIKYCNYADPAQVHKRHVQADLQAFRNQEESLSRSNPTRDILEATLGLWATYRDRGCFGELLEQTRYSPSELEVLSKVRATPEKARRGAKSKETCKGRLRLMTCDQNLLLRCEHWSKTSRKHTSDAISSAKYDLKYFWALFYGDKMTIHFYEETMREEGYGPLVPCTTVRNVSTISAVCPNHHHSGNGDLYMTELQTLPCESKFSVYEPYPEYRQQCPWILLVCRGPHTHAVPALTKTPNTVRTAILSFLDKLDDLANLTTRRLIRSDAAKVFLQAQLPLLSEPTFIDLHCSLNNRDHLQAMINHAQSQRFPDGTGWQGLLRLKASEENLPALERYIRYAEQMVLTDDEEVSTSEPSRLIICVLARNSQHLVQDAQYIQSDISFKRVTGWLEFELGGFDRSGNSSVCYVRAYLNRQTAEAHRLMLLQIHKIVEGDTGKQLRYRHLHANSSNDFGFQGILSWTVDQHGGQAKGIGEYLQAIAPRGKLDLHERARLLTDLDPYDHLRRILRVCKAHFYRNIQECHCESSVKEKMRSLACYHHSSWEETLDYIEKEGNKKAQDWLADKCRCKFAFPALCWERSLIPSDVWRATDGTSNIIESLHQDALIDGGHCSLVGGVLKAKKYDVIQLQTYTISRNGRVPVRYVERTPTVRQYDSVRRKNLMRNNQLSSEDQRIQDQNKALLKAKTNMVVAKRELDGLTEGLGTAEKRRKLDTKYAKAKGAYTKALQSSEALVDENKGSGCVEIEFFLSDDDG
ncbi:hypothetical protein AAF712_015556 [Marasmius tenuissimus]|uniref:Uncharacterized protein n=1 Tax=Marasmius tenuissimus TaxID=585030 RepID=A0ABR2Z8W7_9AGAR